MANGATISPTELSYLSGVTAPLQFQLSNTTIKIRQNSIDYPVARVKFVDTDQYIDVNDNSTYSVEFVGHKSAFIQNNGQFIGTDKIIAIGSRDLEIVNGNQNGINIFNNKKCILMWIRE